MFKIKKRQFLIIVLLLFIISLSGCAHKHEYEENVISPTCSKKGYTEYKCECGDSYISNEVEPLYHNYSEWEVLTKTTCAEKGTLERTCQLCGNKETKQSNESLLQHNYISEIVLPTCTEKGYYKVKCDVCGKTGDHYEYKELGHNYSQWVIVKKATETENGLREKICYGCNEKISEEIIYDEHTHNYTEKPTEEIIYRRITNYNVAMSSAWGLPIQLTLENAKFSCSLTKGSFETLKDVKSIVVDSGETVWYCPVYTPVDQYYNKYTEITETCYMDILIYVEEQVVGYIVMKCICEDSLNYSSEILACNIFVDENNNYSPVCENCVLEILESYHK